MKKTTSFSDKVIQQINSARLFPKVYAKTIRSYITFFKGNILKYPGINPIMTTEGPKAFEEAAQFLEQQKNLPKSSAITVNKELENICKDIVLGLTDVSNFIQLEETDLNIIVGKIGYLKGTAFQVLDFDTELPEILVALLLVDDGNKNRSVRNYIMNEKIRVIGLGRLEHKAYNTSTFILASEEFINADNPDFKKEEATQLTNGFNILRKSCFTPEIRKSINSLVEAMKNVELLEEKFGSKDKEIIDICKKHKQDNKIEDEESSDNVVKMTRSEQIIKIEDKDIKIVVINKVYRDGTVSTEKTKEFLN